MGTVPATTAPPPPTFLQLEVTAACNLRCPMCLVAHRPPVRRGPASVTPAELVALLDDVASVRELSLQGLGEPLLAPDIVELVRIAHERGVEVGFNTNGTLLDEATGVALVEAGLDWLAVSVDGSTQETFEAVRPGAKLDVVCDNVERFVATAHALGGGRPDVRLTMVAMRRNVHDVPGVVRLAHRLGVPTVFVQNLSHDFEDVAAEPGYVEIRRFATAESVPFGDDEVAALARSSFAAARAVAEELGVHLHLPPLDPAPLDAVAPGQPRCDLPWRRAYVTRTGQLQPCCMVMGTERAALGDVRDGFDAVWRGPAATAFREALLGDEPPAVCRGCSYLRGVF